MDKITLYSTHCPRCNVLETKLNQKNIKFDICEDIAVMQSKGFHQAPVLGVMNESGTENYLDFGSAVKWIAEQ